MSSNILFFDAGTGFGGSSTSLLRILEKLDRKRYTPYLLTIENGPNYEAIRKLGIKSFQLESKTLAKNSFWAKVPGIGFFVSKFPQFKAISKICKAEKIDGIVLNTGVRSCLAGLFAAKLRGLPCLSFQRGASRVFSFGEKLFVSWVDHYLAVSKCVEKYVKDFLGDCKRPISVVYEGLDLDQFQNTGSDLEIRSQLGVKQQDLLILLVGRLVQKKGHETFLRAAQKISQVNQSVYFVIAGAPLPGNEDYEAYLKAMAHELGIASRTLFLGWRDDIPKVMRAANIVVNPSEFIEGFGFTNLEAMALAKPVVCSNVGAYPEVVLEGENGFLIPVKDDRALAEKVLYLIENPKEASAFGKKSRERVERMFTIKKTVVEFESILKKYL